MIVRAALLSACAIIVSACAPERRRPPVEEYWSIALEMPEGLGPPPGVQYVNAASIQEFDGARTALTVAFIALPPDLSRASMRLDIMNDFDCAGRRIRPVSTTISGSGAPSTNQEDRTWISVDERANMIAPFEFVCGDVASRAADARFTRINDPRPIAEIANETLAANAAERAEEEAATD